MWRRQTARRRHPTSHNARTNPQHSVSHSTPRIGRRSVLRSATAACLLATVGISPFVQPVKAAIPGVEINCKRCKVAFVSNVPVINRLALYYADGDGTC